MEVAESIPPNSARHRMQHQEWTHMAKKLHPTVQNSALKTPIMVDQKKKNTNHVLDVVSFYPHKSHSQVLQLGDMNFRASRLVYLIIQVKSNIVHDESLIVILDFFFYYS